MGVYTKWLEENKDMTNLFGRKERLEIKCGLLSGLDVSIYAKPGFSYDKMELIRTGLLKDLDVHSYAKEELSYNEMLDIYRQLCKSKGVSDCLYDVDGNGKKITATA